MVLEFIEDVESTKQSEATPTFLQVIKNALKESRNDMRVAMPAVILSYDKNKQLAKVQPSFKRTYQDGEKVSMPPIFNVPVAHPRAGSAIIHMPLKKGDSVLLVFADRSIDKWLTTGGNVDPDDTRDHHLSDAIAYPGLYPSTAGIKIDNTDDIIIKNEGAGGKVEMRLSSKNKLQILNNNEELIKLLYDMIVVMQEAVVYTSTGPQLLRHSKFDELTSRIKTFVKS